MGMGMRHVILHYHIYKNAGSTIDGILQRNFAGQCGSIEAPFPWNTLVSEAALTLSRSSPDLKVISSHQLRLPLPRDNDTTFHPVIFLRHPIDRAASVYAFERRQPADSLGLGVRVARENDLKGYVRWRLEDGHGAVIRNFQVVHLAGRRHDMRTALADRRDLDIACERLRQLPCYGLVERFDESLQRLKVYLEQYFGCIDVHYEIVNRSPERSDQLHTRLAEIKAALGRSLYQELLDKNALDIELYEHALNGLPSI